jgi:hypothetical protein
MAVTSRGIEQHNWNISTFPPTKNLRKFERSLSHDSKATRISVTAPFKSADVGVVLRMKRNKKPMRFQGCRQGDSEDTMTLRVSTCLN